MGVGRGLLEIASLFIGVGLISMLVLHSSDTATVLQSGSDAFNAVLKTATGQGQF